MADLERNGGRAGYVAAALLALVVILSFRVPGVMDDPWKHPVGHLAGPGGK